MNSERDRTKEPSSTYVVDELPKITLQARDLKVRPTCAVCTCDFDIGEEVLHLPCSHVYHEDCHVAVQALYLSHLPLGISHG